MLNPWTMPQQRIELPSVDTLTIGDLQTLETLDKFKNEKWYEIYFEPNDEEDYAVWSLDQSGKKVVTRVSKCVTINNTRWYILPGKNKVPKSVYELLQQCEADAQDKRIHPGVIDLGPLEQYRQ